MAVSLSSTLSNFLSFISTTKPPSPPPQQPQLNLPPSPTPTPFHSSQTLKTKPSHNSVILSQQPHATSSSSCEELSSVLCPSLAYANTLFFNSAYNLEVVVNEDESEEKLLDMLFRREVMKANVIQESKTRSFNSKTNTRVIAAEVLRIRENHSQAW